MKINYLIIIICILFSCKTDDRFDKSIVIINNSISTEDSIEIELKNIDLSKKFYFLLRNDKVFYKKKANTLIAHIYKGKDSLKVNETIVSTSPFFVDDEDEEEYLSYIDSLKQEIFRSTTSQRILKSNELLKIRTIFRNYEIDEITDNEYKILLDSTDSYQLQLSYTSDSSFVKQNISKELLDSLRKNDIKIFHGTIYSNKVPLKFE